MVRLQNERKEKIMSETKKDLLYDTLGILIGLSPWVYLIAKYDA